MFFFLRFSFLAGGREVEVDVSTDRKFKNKLTFFSLSSFSLDLQVLALRPRADYRHPRIW